jgi:hypothetical protein
MWTSRQFSIMTLFITTILIPLNTGDITDKKTLLITDFTYKCLYLEN